MLATTDLTNSYLIWGMHIFLSLHPVIDSSQAPIGIAACRTGIYTPCIFYCGCFFLCTPFSFWFTNVWESSPVHFSPVISDTPKEHKRVEVRIMHDKPLDKPGCIDRHRKHVSRKQTSVSVCTKVSQRSQPE